MFVVGCFCGFECGLGVVEGIACVHGFVVM